MGVVSLHSGCGLTSQWVWSHCSVGVVSPGAAAPLEEGFDSTAVAMGRDQVLSEDGQTLIGLVNELGHIVGGRAWGIPCHATSPAHHCT